MSAAQDKWQDCGQRESELGVSPQWLWSFIFSLLRDQPGFYVFWRSLAIVDLEMFLLHGLGRTLLILELLETMTLAHWQNEPLQIVRDLDSQIEASMHSVLGQDTPAVTFSVPDGSAYISRAFAMRIPTEGLPAHAVLKVNLSFCIIFEK